MGATVAAVRGARGVVQLAGGMIAAASIVYLLLALWRVTRYRRAAGLSPVGLPAVTVLKPICGADPGLYECLRSFCEQDHPRTQLIFGLRDPVDPAIPVIERVIKEFQGHDLALVIDPRVHGINLQVSIRRLGTWLFQAWMTARMRNRLRAAGIETNDWLPGLGDTGHMRVERLRGYLARLPDGISEFYVHPVVERGAGNEAWPSAYESRGEFEALTDPDVLALARGTGIEPVCFARLGDVAA